MTTPTDPLYAQQWHFDLLANGRTRAIVEQVWDELSGAGVHVGVYDTGIEIIHPDLDDNYDASLEVVIGGVAQSGERTSDSAHGTAVSGIIAAELNGEGAVGIAWGAGVTGLNFINVPFANPNFNIALHQMTNFDVVNHSWGNTSDYNSGVNPLDPASVFGSAYLVEYAHSVEEGRGGLGTNIVQSHGNDNLNGTGDGINQSRLTISVNALLETGFVTSYSNFGAETLVSAPGGDAGAPPVDGTRHVTTTDLLGTDGFNLIADPGGAHDYTDWMNGTSAAAPMVSGVIALMLEANPNLGWRDVQDILAATAFHSGSAFGAGPAGNEGYTWFFNGASNWNGGGMHFSEDYGYGNVDLFGAVRMAEAYGIMGLAPQTSANEVLNATAVLPVALLVPDAGPTVSFNFDFVPQMAIEHIDVTIFYSGTDLFPGDLTIELVSPAGTAIEIATGDVSNNSFAGWIYGIDGLRGELTQGTWTLNFLDVVADFEVTVDTVQMAVYGEATSPDDVYHFTDEFAGMAALEAARTTVSDSDGGADWIDASAVSTPSTLSLDGLVSVIGGQALTIADTIENAIGGDGVDVISGNSSDNHLYGGRGDDSLNGDDGADRLFGGAGDDDLDGGAGADRLYGGAGQNDLAGGADNDWYFIASASDVIVEGAAGGAADRAFASVSYQLAVGVEIEVVSTDNHAGTAALDFIGNELANTIVGNDGTNVLTGGGEADVLQGFGGVDTLNGDDGADRLFGGAGDDDLNGGAGADRLYGGAGQNDLAGGADNDWYFIASASDVIVEGAAGGAADRAFASVSYQLAVGVEIEVVSTDNHAGTAALDFIGNELANTIVGNDGTNVLTGGGEADVLQGFGGVDTLNGDDGADRLFGGAGDDDLNGGAGADRLYGGAGQNDLAGGADDDWYFITSASDVIVEGAAGGAADRAFASVSYQLAVGVEIEVVSTDNHAGTAALDFIGNELANTIVGNDGTNVLTGGGEADALQGFGGVDTLNGDDGADQLFGGAGDDDLNGGAGADRLYGGAGQNDLVGGADDDWYFITSASEVVIETAGGGTVDRVFASISYELAAGAEIEIFSTDNHAGTGAIDLTGNELASLIFGNAGSNLINGKAGNDQLWGFGGFDMFMFDTALDAATNVDRIRDFDVADDFIRLDPNIFATLGPGLDADEFVIGAAALDAEDRIIYDSATGALSYDADGNGNAIAAVQFATLGAGLILTEAQFFVVV